MGPAFFNLNSFVDTSQQSVYYFSKALCCQKSTLLFDTLKIEEYHFKGEFIMIKKRKSHPKVIFKLFIGILLALSFKPIYSNPFIPLERSHHSYSDINKIVKSGLMKNYAQGMFTDKTTVTRYQMATIISKLVKKASKMKPVIESNNRILSNLVNEFKPELELLGWDEIPNNKFKTESKNMELQQKKSPCNNTEFSGSLFIRPEFFSTGRPAGDTREDSKSMTWYAIKLNALKKLDKADIFASIQQNGYFGERENQNTYDLGTITDTSGSKNKSAIKEFWTKLYLDKNRKKTLKIGRQSLNFGLPMHVAPCNWRSGRSLDGIIYEDKSISGFNWNMFYSKLNQNENWYDLTLVSGIAAPEQEADLLGFNLGFLKVKNNKFKLSYFEKTIDDLKDADPDLRNKTKTLALDWKGGKNNYKYRLHYADQGGYSINKLGSKTDYNGNMLLLEMDYKLIKNFNFGIHYARFSGDDKGFDNRAYQPIFPACHQYAGQADQFLMSNLKSLTFSLSHNTTSNLKCSLDFHKFALDNVSSSPTYYNYGLPSYARPVHNSSNTEDDLGFEWDLTFDYRYSKNITFKLGHSKFTSGDYFNDPAQGGYSFDTNWSYLYSDIKF